METHFDILKKIDVLNLERVGVARDLKTTEARIQKLQAHSPGGYVVFSQSAQQIVARFHSSMESGDAKV